MEHITITNYNEIKEELVERITQWTASCHTTFIQLSLQADPKESKFNINDITCRGYYNPYEVILERYEGCYDDPVSRYFINIKDIADALGKTMKDLIEEVANQPEYVDWLDPVEVTWEDVHNYVCTVKEYKDVLYDLYAEFVRTDCHEFIQDTADRLLDDAIDFMEIKYGCEIEIK